MHKNAATIEARIRILQGELAKLTEKFLVCATMAAHGDDFHDAWNAAMTQQTEFLGQLHRWKISLVGLPDPFREAAEAEDGMPVSAGARIAHVQPPGGPHGSEQGMS